MNDYLTRSKMLLGNDKIDSFQGKVILVAGLGGVGGTALETLARSGFTNFVLVDFDKVDPSNLNRQILFTDNDLGKDKTEIAKNRILSINCGLNVQIINQKIDENFVLPHDLKIDFIVDAIDYIPGKLWLIQFALKNNIPFISSLGMGNRIDPSMVKITNLNKTEGDPLARKIRYECRQLGLDLSKIKVVFSTEEPILVSKTPASMMMVPSAAGLLIAKYVITTIK